MATYGEGLTALVLLPLPRDVGRRVLRGIDPGDDDGRGTVRTPLVSAAVVRVPGRRGWFLLAGTVPGPLVDRAVTALLADPPEYVR